MRFGSVCSGIEAASVAWNPLGWEAAWFSEIEPFPCALLAHRYPNVPLTVKTMRVRKLTPIETERLQGFPDNYTRIPYRGKSEEDCPDSPRYKAIGNSWAVPVVRWIGKRIVKQLGET